MTTRLQKIAYDTMQKEISAIQMASNSVYDDSFLLAIQTLKNARLIITSACGASSAVARRLSHQLCCFGCSSVYLYPSDAAHGELGLIRSGDVLFLISRSGQTDELVPLVESAQRKGAVVIALTENDSLSFKNIDIILKVPQTNECDKYGLVSTSSSTAMCAFLDGLVCALMEESHVDKEQFSLNHPGGFVGKKLKG